jgi:universal stress protein E
VASKKVLVVISNADSGEQQAIDRAVGLAVKTDVELELFQCVYDADLEGYPWSQEEDHAQFRSLLVEKRSSGLGRLVEMLRRQGLSTSATAMWDYPIYEGIVRRALAIEADLIVSTPLGPPRHRGFASADWRLISNCPMPLLMVKSSGIEDYRHVAAAIDPLQTRDKPMLLDEMILRQAAEMAQLFDAQLSAIHCFPPLTEIGEFGPDSNLAAAEVEAKLEETSKAAVAHLVSEQGLEPQTARFIRDTPIKALPRFVQDEGVDLLAIGALSRGRIADFIIGSTAEVVLDSTSCDLLIVKPQGFRSSISQSESSKRVTEPIFYRP